MTSDNLLPDGPGTTVLDAAALDKLRELDPSGVNGVLRRVLQAYEQSLARMMGELGAARVGRDHETVSRVAHTLKSSSASVGAMALSRRCAAAEKLVRSQPAGAADEASKAALNGELDALLDALMVEAAGALAAVRAMLHD